MRSSASPDPGAAELPRRGSSAGAGQALIDAHFGAAACYWASVYRDDALPSRIYRDRAEMALAWIARLALPPGSSVLEVGPGAGLVTTELARAGFAVTAVERVPSMLDATRATAEAAGLGHRLTAVPGDVHALPFADERFELVVALGVLPWAGSPAGALSEMARVTRPGGYVLASADNRHALTACVEPLTNPLWRPLVVLVKQALERRGIRRRRAAPNPPLSAARLERMLAERRLTLVEHETIGFGPFTLMRRQVLRESLGRRLYAALDRGARRGVPGLRSAGAQQLFVARKAAANAGPAVAPRRDVDLRALLLAGRLCTRTPALLRHPMTPERARPLLAQRLARREHDFLAVARTAIFAYSASPYRGLFAAAGCEYGDLERLVRDEGVEGALAVLQRRGVYLTVDEFKGREPVVRGSATVAFEPGLLANPLATPHVLSQTSGSRGAATAVPIDVAHLRDRLVDLSLVFDARGGGRWEYALWGIPGGAALINLLLFAGTGARVVRWFSQLDAGRARLDWRYRWSPRVVKLSALAAGVSLPAPQHVPPDAPLTVAAWMSEVLRRGATPHLYAYTSTGVALCEAAAAAGIPLAGAQLTVTGEPITERRREAIHAAGVEVSTNYGSSECGGFIGYGCLSPERSDEVHVLEDLHAVAQVVGDDRRLPHGALLISSLRPTAPLVLLNVSLGDTAHLSRRACGCPLQRLGWSTHLHTIRSFEKLTAGGISLLAADAVRVLDEVLPQRFGGGATSYQVVEEEGSDGRPVVRLRVDPAVGPLDERAVADAFLSALGRGSGGERVAELVWREGAFLGVERRVPERTRSGKVNHVHAGLTGAGR